MTIVRSEEESVEPSSESDIVAKVIDGEQTALYVADQLDLSLSDVYESFSYYYAHTEEIREIERENREAYGRLREESLKPKEPVR